MAEEVAAWRSVAEVSSPPRLLTGSEGLQPGFNAGADLEVIKENDEVWDLMRREDQDT